jgi:hypothetical protein
MASELQNHSAARTRVEDSPLPGLYERDFMKSPVRWRRHREKPMSKMKKATSNVKGVLNQKVRLGLFSVPLWVVGLVVVGKALRARRREQRYA